MRADYALSHLEDEESHRAATKHGEHDVHWNQSEWRFYYDHTPEPRACDFAEIEEWQIAAIKPFPQDHAKRTMFGGYDRPRKMAIIKRSINDIASRVFKFFMFHVLRISSRKRHFTST